MLRDHKVFLEDILEAIRSIYDYAGGFLTKASPRIGKRWTP